ncbi:MAG: hypothetical protein ACR2N1_06165 [Rubripirellula sp.]
MSFSKQGADNGGSYQKTGRFTGMQQQTHPIGPKPDSKLLGPAFKVTYLAFLPRDYP